MPVADYATYCSMLDRARTEKFAYPAVNVTSLTTANAVLKGLAESGSDGIIQVSTGGAAFASGSAVKDMVLGAISIAEHVHRVADRYPIRVALYTTPEDTLEVVQRLNPRAGPRYLMAATFGNVHGVYKPGHVTLKPSILKACQDAAVAKYGESARFYFVFHGGSGSDLRDIHEALDYGVVKMNVDTDMQYAFTRGIVDHFFKHYDGVLRVDGEVGSKKAYDPRTYLAVAENAMANRVRQAASDLRSAGMTMMN